MESLILVTRVQSFQGWHEERAFWFNAFDLLFSNGDDNHSLSENFKKCLIDVDLRSSRRGTEKYIFSVFLPTLCLHGERLEGELCKWLMFGGACRVEPTTR